MQCALDSASPKDTSSNGGTPEKQSIRSPIHEQPTPHSSIPARRIYIPMDPVLQAERLRAAQELEALRRAQEEELILSQTGAPCCDLVCQQILSKFCWLSVQMSRPFVAFI